VLSQIGDKAFSHSNQALGAVDPQPVRRAIFFLSPASDDFCAVKRTAARWFAGLYGVGPALVLLCQRQVLDSYGSAFMAAGVSARLIRLGTPFAIRDCRSPHRSKPNIPKINESSTP
jgi:hypothetical protein